MPLYEQVLDRIEAKIAAKLGTGRNTRDRYFIIPFAYENRGNDPAFSHSFMTVVRVLADGRTARQRADLKTGRYKRWHFEAFNISWIPNDFLENPNLCVFHGFGSRLVASWNTCPLSVGKNFTLQETLQIAVNAKVAVGMWGPYEITKEGFDRGIKRKKILEAGKIKYRADDRITRKDQTAINCFHAMGSIDELFPNGGAFGTGFNMWGLNGTKRVLIEYTTKASNKGLLLDPVNYKEDVYGFVYAPTREHRRVYNPFKQSSAYGKRSNGVME
jgi:hypothetical protein